MFCNEVKGKSALALSRDLSLSYKSAFVLLHKLREAMAEEMCGLVVGGEGKEAEIDGEVRSSVRSIAASVTSCRVGEPSCGADDTSAPVCGSRVTIPA